MPNDPREILTAALTLARSGSAADHASLQSQLSDAAFVASLDSPEEYRQTGRRLRIARVLDALATNPAPSSKEVLIHLLQDADFISEPIRVDYLIRYTAGLRPPPQPLLAFWDAHSQPEDGFTPLTIEALTTNGTEQALILLEKKIIDPEHPDDDKQYWMRSYMLPHRNEVPVLRMVERLVTATAPDRLKPDLIAATFDYRPDQWYSEHSIVRAPDRAAASPEAKALVRRIGEFALKSVRISSALQAVVRRVLSELSA